jgi:hypothetical protein
MRGSGLWGQNNPRCQSESGLRARWARRARRTLAAASRERPRAQTGLPLLRAQQSQRSAIVGSRASFGPQKRATEARSASPISDRSHGSVSLCSDLGTSRSLVRRKDDPRLVITLVRQNSGRYALSKSRSLARLPPDILADGCPAPRARPSLSPGCAAPGSLGCELCRRLAARPR